LLSKSSRYFYDADAIREEPLWPDGPNAPDAIASPHGQGFTAGRSNGTPHSAGRNKRSVWEITTQPYPEAHFATFPPKLVEPCILAGSPPKCCGDCGAPWERVVEREGEKVAARQARTTRDYQPGLEEKTGWQYNGAALTPAGGKPIHTLGWRSTCDHDDDSGTAIVLDPFCGSGTTGLVALRHNRSFIGIELNPTYAEMARNRIRDDAPLFNANTETVA
jgi:hypothetical protein